MSDEGDQLERGWAEVLKDLGNRCADETVRAYATEHPFRPLPHLISVWRPIHLLAMRGISTEHVTHCERLRLYVAAVQMLNGAVEHDAEWGKLKLRDTRTGLPRRLRFSEKPHFHEAGQWNNALMKKNTALVYGCLRAWREGRYIHFDERVAVARSAFIEWAESNGISPPGELDQLLADAVPAIEPNASGAEPSSTTLALSSERATEPVADSAANGGAPLLTTNGRNSKKDMNAYIAHRASEIYRAGEATTEETIAKLIARELKEKEFKGPTGIYQSAGTVKKAIPTGLTGGLKKNGRKADGV